MSKERHRRNRVACLVWGIAMILAGYGAVSYEPFNLAGPNLALFLLLITIIGFAKSFWPKR